MPTFDNSEIKRVQRSVDALNRKFDKIMDVINADLRVPDRLISLREASKLLRRSEYCLRQDIREGKIPAKKVGRGWLVSFNEVQKLVSAPQ